MKEEIELSLNGERLEVQSHSVWHLARLLGKLLGILFVIELAMQIIWLTIGGRQ